MNLPELSVKRYVFTAMVSLTLILFGAISFSRLGVDQFPKVEFPMLSVSTTMPGADSEIIDKNITAVLEEEVNQVSGVKSITSTSSLGASTINVEFELEKNVDIAYQEVKAKVDGALRQLPDDANPPIVRKQEAGAFASLYIVLIGNRTQQDLNRYAEETIKPRLETITGVGEVTVNGRRQRTIRIWIDPDRLRAYNIAPADISAAINNEHVQQPAGFINSKTREWLIKFNAEFSSVSELERLIVTYRQGSPIYLKDIARVEDGLADARQIARFNGQPSVGLGIVKTSEANTVALVDSVRERIESEIRPALPPGLELQYAFDNSTSIRRSIAALNEHLIIGTLFASLLVFLFLKSFRSTIIIATAIPVSLLATFGAMYFVGFTLNVITLLGLLLLIGVVVDDAIVVLENVFRHREEQHQQKETAAIDGSKQVVFAVIASTLTLVSIFLPVAFISGMVGRFLSSFALVVVIGVVVSLWVSLTLTPMLCARFLELPKTHGRVYQFLERAFKGMERGYRRFLDLALAHRWKVVGLAALMVASSSYFFIDIGKAFVPDEDQSRFSVSARTPLGSNLAYTDGKLREVEEILARRPEVKSYFSFIGSGSAGQVNSGRVIVNLVDRDERELSQAQIMSAVRRELSAVPGIRTSASNLSSVQGQRGDPLQFAVQGPDLLRVSQISDQMIAKLDDVPGIVKLDKDVQLDLPELRLRLDRERAAQLGVSAAGIAQTLNIMTSGVDIADFRDGSNRYDIRLQIEPDERASADVLKKIYVRNRQSDLVRLDSMVYAEEGVGPAVVTRRNRQYASVIYGSLENLPLGAATAEVERVAAETLPPGYSLTYLGSTQEFQKTQGYMLFAFSLALVMIYMVLASQFNSLLQPLVVMIAQPLAIIGGVVALWAFGQTLNLFSMIGMILLMGLVAKNSILLIDLTNQYRAQGKSIYDALTEACPHRMRPVLITSLTVIGAMMSAAIGLGPGVETNRPLALVIIGGVISSTLLTLVVVPAVYSLVEGARERRAQRKRTATPSPRFGFARALRRR